MSAVCILAPVVIAGGRLLARQSWPPRPPWVTRSPPRWPSAIGTVAEKEQSGSVSLEIARSEVVTSQLGRDQRMSVTREGVTVTFSRDARGKAALCVTGSGQDDATLRALGEELSRAVVQQYVYQKLMDEMRSRGFVVVEQETNEDRSIRLKVRHWEG